MFVPLLVTTIFVWCGALLYSLSALPSIRNRRHPAVTAVLLVAAALLSFQTFRENQRLQVRQQFQRHYRAGIDERERGNLEEAERELQQAEAIDPGRPDVQQQLEEIRQQKPAEKRVQTRATRVDPAALPPSTPSRSTDTKPAPDRRPGQPPKPLAHKPSPFEITHYGLEVKLDPEAHSLDAVATLRVKSRGGEVRTLDFSLHPECKPSAAQVDGRAAAFTHPNDLLTVTPVSPLKPGHEQVVTVTYQRTGKAVMGGGTGLISPDGIYFISEARWYPATGELDFRSPVSVKATVPKGFTVVSVGALKGLEKTDKTATYHWETDRLASMVSLAAGKYVQQSLQAPMGDPGSPTLPISCYTFAPHRKRAGMFLKEAASVVRFYSKRFGPYPYEKLAVVEIPLFPGGYGTTSFVMLIDQSFAADRIDPFRREFLAHEIAHQWWGNSVFPQGMGAAWLSEAFANYSAWWYASEAAGNPRVLRKRVAKASSDYFEAAAQRGEQSIYDSDPYQPVGARDETIYEKGAVVLHMLRLQIGDPAFKRLLRRFADKYRFGKADIEAFRKLAEAEAGAPLGWFFDQWLGRKGGMELTYSFDTVPFSKTENQAVLTLNQAGPAYRAKLNVVLQVESSVQRQQIQLGEAHQEFRLPVKGKVQSVLLDPDGEYLMKPPRWVVTDSAGGRETRSAQ